MCGICGQVRFDGKLPDEAVVLRMRETLRHRGPDDEGIWSEATAQGGVALGHTRLAILDLSSAGHQPMCDASGRYWICYNGEVYNYLELRAILEKDGYSFCSRTDTEVILAAYAKWGKGCIDRFIGMFAFAIWDRDKTRLFCARDRLGIKPFYYTLRDNVFLFASEIKSLVRTGVVRPRPNECCVYDYLAFGLLDHSAETFFQDVRQLEPGTYLVYSEDGVTTGRYWSIGPDASGVGSDPEEEFRELFYDAVRLRLRSDVAVGILLSGGLDSSSITCAAAEIMAPGKPATFSSTLKGIGRDERAYSDSVARHVGARNTVLTPSGNMFWEEVDAMHEAQDEPVHASDIYANWCMMREVHAQGIKVLLNGQGGDELFAGYGWYAKNLLASCLLRGDIGSFVRELFAMKKNFPGTTAAGFVSLLMNTAEALLPAALKPLFKQELAGMGHIGKRRFMRLFRGRNAGNISLMNAAPLEQKLRNDILYFTVPHYLHYEDRNSMHFSIEQRLPFLDHRLVEWANRLPAGWKIRNGTTKYVVRQALRGRLPADVVRRRDKMGLSIPIEAWMRGELADKFLAFFRQDCSIYNAWIDRANLWAYLEKYMRGKRTPIDRILWRVFSLEKWCRIFCA